MNNLKYVLAALERDLKGKMYSPAVDKSRAARRPWCRWFWGKRGSGLDLQPSCRMWGVKIGMGFFGLIRKDKTNAVD